MEGWPGAQGSDFGSDMEPGAGVTGGMSGAFLLRLKNDMVAIGLGVGRYGISESDLDHGLDGRVDGVLG